MFITILEVLTDRNKKKKHINFPSPPFHIPSVTVLFLELRVTDRKTTRKLNQTIASPASKLYFQKHQIPTKVNESQQNIHIT